MLTNNNINVTLLEKFVSQTLKLLKMIYCLMFTGIPLNDPIRDLLFFTAQEMFADKKEYQNIKNEWCEGYIKTDWAVSGIGCRYGTIFSAHLDTEFGKTEVTYITTHQKVKKGDGVWVSIPSDEESFSLN